MPAVRRRARPRLRAGARGNPRGDIRAQDRLIAGRQRGFEFFPASLGLQPLIGHALQPHARRAFAGASRLDPDQQVAARELRSLPARTRRLHFLATLFAFGLESAATRIERVERHPPAIEFGTGACQRVLREARLARDFRGLLFKTFAPQGRLLGTRAFALELPEQIGVIAMCALDRLCATSRSRSACASSSRQLPDAPRLRAPWLRCRRVRAQLLEALFALEHARVRIAATVDAQPVRPIHSPERVITDSSWAISRRSFSASTSLSASRTRDSSRTMAAGPDTTPDNMPAVPSASMCSPACNSDIRPTGSVGNTSTSASSSSTHSASR